MSRAFRDFPPLEENIRFFIKDFGAKRILSEMTAEEIIEGLEEDKRKNLLEKLNGVETEKLENPRRKELEGQQEK